MPKTKKLSKKRVPSDAPYLSRQQIQFNQFVKQLDPLSKVSDDKLSYFDACLHACMCAVVDKRYKDVDLQSYRSIVTGLTKKIINQSVTCIAGPITLSSFVDLLAGRNKELARSVIEVMRQCTHGFFTKKPAIKEVAIKNVLLPSLPAVMSWCSREEVNDKEEAGLFLRGVAIIAIVSHYAYERGICAWMVNFFNKHQNASASRFLNNFDQCLKKMTDDQKEKKSFLCLTKFHDKLKGELQRTGLLQKVSDSSGKSDLPQKQSGVSVEIEEANELDGDDLDDLAGLLKGMKF